MSTKLSIVILLFMAATFYPMTSHSLVFFEPGLGALSGDFDADETTDGERFEHDALLFGVEVSARAGLNIFGFQVGGTASHQRTHMAATREVKLSELHGSSYTNTLAISLTGLYAGLRLPNTSFRLMGELYTEAKLRLHYAKPKSANLFTNRDRMKGKGYGLGVGYLDKKNGSMISVLYRSLDFERFTNDGVQSNLPDGNLTRPHIDQIVLQITIFAHLP
ncbi:MAG: hypothetical protein HN509_04885 [Halobacteriovoraceae bacterium]|jgi:hypothetical protein|nr:hypothetical protein [Halobacteriovoraceae bacterium]MBT5094772.1 hypothetical protein [Halobacteriovoraceae bacterium]